MVADGLVIRPPGPGDASAFRAMRLRSLREHPEAVDDLMARRGWGCRLAIKARFGTAVAGPFGAAGAKRHDLIGRAVNIAATLGGSGVTLSVEAFWKLGPAVRARLKKHTPPITYIRTEDPHRSA